MATTADIPRLEMLQVADMVAREKGIEREEVLEAMEQAIQKAGRAKYGLEHDIRAEIDRKTGEIKLLRYMQVADPIENESVQVALVEAQRRNPEAQVGDFLTDELPPIDFGRVAAQTAKQVITGKVREAERARQYDDFKDRVGEIVSGVVKRVDYGNITVDLQRAEGVIRRDETIPRESLRVNDRVRAYIFDVREEPRGPQIFLSRSHPQFMAKLFTQEVPEIYDGIIEIKAVARDPGSRAKIAVLSHDSSIDPIGACVGMRGSRVQAVVQELQGEKVDIIPWSGDTANFIVNALAPAEVSKVLMDEEKNKTEVVVPDDQLSLAIGRRGQNVKLASQLTGWEIDIMTEAEESERRQKETRERTELFKATLDVDDVIAHLLVAEGYAAVCIDTMSDSGVAALRAVRRGDPDAAAGGVCGRCAVLSRLGPGHRPFVLAAPSAWPAAAGRDCPCFSFSRAAHFLSAVCDAQPVAVVHGSHRHRSCGHGDLLVVVIGLSLHVGDGMAVDYDLATCVRVGFE